jgi:hypothetical protein
MLHKFNGPFACPAQQLIDKMVLYTMAGCLKSNSASREDAHVMWERQLAAIARGRSSRGGTPLPGNS